MPLVYDNFPDEVWARLKGWAKRLATGTETPTSDDCCAYVRHVASQITGNANALRQDVVEFYAAETSEMIARYRAELAADSAGQIA